MQDLRTFSRLDETERKRTRIVPGLTSTLGLVRANFVDRIEFISDFTTDPMLYCWPAQLNQVFMNMMINACQAILGKAPRVRDQIAGQLTITTFTENNELGIRFQDTGCGISRQDLEKIFEPFYTTKPIGEGTGLGLSISHGIIQRHLGSITVTPEEGVGSTFTIYLPLSSPRAISDVSGPELSGNRV